MRRAPGGALYLHLYEEVSCIRVICHLLFDSTGEAWVTFSFIVTESCRSKCFAQYVNNNQYQSKRIHETTHNIILVVIMIGYIDNKRNWLNHKYICTWVWASGYCIGYFSNEIENCFSIFDLRLIYAKEKGPVVQWESLVHYGALNFLVYSFCKLETRCFDFCF